MAVWWSARPRGASGRGTASGLALFVPDGGRARQADGLAPGGEPLVLLGDTAKENLIKYSPNEGGNFLLKLRWCVHGARASQHISYKMDKKLFDNLIDLFIIKYPDNQSKVEGAFLRENSLGVARLCDSSGNVLLKIKKDYVFNELQTAKDKSNKVKNKKAKDEQAVKLGLATRIKTHAGLEDNFFLHITSNRKEMLVTKFSWSEPNKIVKIFAVSDCLVEEVRTEQKKVCLDQSQRESLLAGC